MYLFLFLNIFYFFPFIHSFFNNCWLNMFQMDPLVGLFDPGSGSSSDEGGSWESDVSTSSTKRKTQFCKNKNRFLLNDNDEQKLPPEPQLGNIEYKLKLVNPSRLRFEHLVTQVSHFTVILYEFFLLLTCFFNICICLKILNLVVVTDEVEVTRRPR